MKARYSPTVYEAMKRAGHSNVEIGKLLGVSEAAVRRGLHSATFTPEHPFGRPEPQTRTYLVTVTEQ